jgi:hypothetical protein
MSNHDPKPTKYQVTVVAPGLAQYTSYSWNCRRDGRPTGANLRKHIKSFEAATKPGGVNAHLGEVTVLRAEIRLNDGSRKVVVSYEAPGVHRGYMFEVISEYNN